MTRIYESRSHILISTGYADPVEHCHKAAHLIISMNQNMTVSSGNLRFFCRGVLIPSGVTHSIGTQNDCTLVFLFDSTTKAAAKIKEIQLLPETSCDVICSLFSEFEADGSDNAYLRFENHVLKMLGLDPDCNVTDERILSAMKQIRTHLCEPLFCRDVAEFVCLSQSRFSHLFRQQVGMTFSAYLVYQRLLYVYTRILSGAAITEAALEASFSSSSHFADVNRRVFGLPASDITKDLTFIKVQ